MLLPVKMFRLMAFTSANAPIEIDVIREGEPFFVCAISAVTISGRPSVSASVIVIKQGTDKVVQTKVGNWPNSFE